MTLFFKSSSNITLIEWIQICIYTAIPLSFTSNISDKSKKNLINPGNKGSDPSPEGGPNGNGGNSNLFSLGILLGSVSDQDEGWEHIDNDFSSSSDDDSSVEIDDSDYVNDASSEVSSDDGASALTTSTEMIGPDRDGYPAGWNGSFTNDEGNPLYNNFEKLYNTPSSSFDNLSDTLNYYGNNDWVGDTLTYVSDVLTCTASSDTLNSGAEGLASLAGQGSEYVVIGVENSDVITTAAQIIFF